MLILNEKTVKRQHEINTPVISLRIFKSMVLETSQNFDETATVLSKVKKLLKSFLYALFVCENS